MIVAILQARMSSTRLPGKVSKPILGKPMVARHIERLRRCNKLDHILLATSDETSDDSMVEVAKAADVPLYRGSLPDVLDRYYQAALTVKPEHVVRLTADCPLADWRIIDAVIEKHLRLGTDYCSNTIPMTFPDGLDAEITTFAALERAAKEAATNYQREHVTPFIKEGTTFNRHCIQRPTDLSAVRWTVDTPADFDFAKAIYEALYEDNPAFTAEDILAFAKTNPDVLAINNEQEAITALLKEETIWP